MIRKSMLVIAMLVAMVIMAGCGGKKATEAPPPVEPTNGGATETVQDIPATSDPVPSDQVAPLSVNDVFFDFDSYSLSAEARGTLESNAAELKRVTTGNVTIEGHCDERGTQAYNLALGEKRANAAKEFLVAAGVDGSRINTVSYGKERPFDDGHDESAWAKNRRAHFVTGQ